jgi:hypothetical protein
MGALAILVNTGHMREDSMLKKMCGLKGIMALVGTLVMLTAIVTMVTTSMAGPGTNNASVAWMAIKSPISSTIIPERGEVEAPSATKAIELLATPGEFEPASFVLAAKQNDVPNIRIQASDLISDFGRTFGQGVVSSRYRLVRHKAFDG